MTMSQCLRAACGARPGELSDSAVLFVIWNMQVLMTLVVVVVVIVKKTTGLLPFTPCLATPQTSYCDDGIAPIAQEAGSNCKHKS